MPIHHRDLRGLRDKWSVALAVLFVGIGFVELIVLSI
jgi:hypothetical protein